MWLRGAETSIEEKRQAEGVGGRGRAQTCEEWQTSVLLLKEIFQMS